MSTRVPSRMLRFAVLLAALPLPLAAAAGAQTHEAVRTRYQAPVYPENLLKSSRQGNVMLVGRIDALGHVADLHVVASTHTDFVRPAAEAVAAWQFKPATRDGLPVEIFANIGVRFRLQGEKRGLIPAPILGDIVISPADESGKATAPEGFPIRRGKDKALRAEAVIDLPPNIQLRTLAVQVEARAPSGKRIAIFQPPVAVLPTATEVRIPVVAKVGPDWEEGVWMLRFTVNGAGAGAGQFWLASDPAHFSFVIPKS